MPSPATPLGMSCQFYLTPACALWTFFPPLSGYSIAKCHAPSRTKQGQNTTPLNSDKRLLLIALHRKSQHSWGCSLTSLQKSLKIITPEVWPFRKLPQKFSINQTIVKYEGEQPALKGSSQAINLSWWKHNLKNSCFNQVHILKKKKKKARTDLHLPYFVTFCFPDTSSVLGK